MTNEKAKKIIFNQWQTFLEDNIDYAGISEAYKMAIKALEQQPCIEDYPTCTECEHYDNEKHYCPRFCQVIKDTLAEAQPSEEDFVKHKKEVLERIAKREAEIDKYIKELEKCNQQPGEDAVSRQAVINTIFYKSDNSCDVVLSTDLMDRIKQLPSVTPQRKRGKWIFREDMGHQYCCSECGCPKPSVNDYYYKKIIGCPYCLADMSGGGEGETDN